jgi:hypothetical protein
LDPQHEQHLLGLSGQVVSLYFKVKKYVIQSEKLSSGARISIPALNELRNAYDHYMRSEAVWRHGLQLKKGTEQDPFKYCEKNLHKALGHVYRAGYDALDIIALNRIREIERYVDSYRISTIYKVIHDYATRIRKPYTDAVKKCDEAKQGKDIEPEKTDEHPVFFAKYEAAISELDSVLEVLHNSDEGIREVEEATLKKESEAAKQYRKQRNLAIIGIGVTLIVGIIGVVVTYRLAH